MPIGGKTLEAMRQKGKRPPGFILVTEARDIAANYRKRDIYPLVFEPEKAYDWTVIHGLDVQFVTRLPRGAVGSTCLAILNAAPRTLYATYHGRHEIEKDAVIPHAAR